jgi:hypothetical protein
LSLTDYIQHRYAPGEPEADRYYRDMDALFGRICSEVQKPVAPDNNWMSFFGVSGRGGTVVVWFFAEN